jgi:nitrile hydratase accessory protein
VPAGAAPAGAAPAGAAPAGGAPAAYGASSASFAACEGLPRGAEGPVFHAQWEAQAFALAIALHERGCFTWPEWTAALAAEIGAARDRREPDDGSRYYEFWLAALEKLALAKGLVGEAERLARRDAWERAARATPHGKPIELPR